MSAPHDHRADPWSAPAAAVVDPPGYAASQGYGIPQQTGPYGSGAPWPPGVQPHALPRAPRSLRGLGRTTVALLVCQAVLGIVGAGVSAWGVLTWSRVSAASADVRLAPDEAEMLLLALRAPLGALTGIAFVAWLWVATANARSAGARVRHAPSWALWGWVVPVLSLWRPKQMVDDLWRASQPGVPTGVDLRLVQKPLVVVGWWAAFLVGSSLPAVGVVRAVMASVVPQVQAVTDGVAPVPVDMARVHESVAMWNLSAAVFLVVAAGLAIVFVRRVTQWQEEWISPDRADALRRPAPRPDGAAR